MENSIMDLLTLDDFIEEHMKDKAFADAYRRELRINEKMKVAMEDRKAKRISDAEYNARLAAIDPEVYRLNLPIE